MHVVFLSRRTSLMGRGFKDSGRGLLGLLFYMRCLEPFRLRGQFIVLSRQQIVQIAYCFE
jgi:hypothetical protein